MARSCDCRIVLDLSVVWHVAFNTVIAGVVHGIITALKKHCEVVYTEFTREEILINEKLTDSEKQRLVAKYESLGRYVKTGISKQKVLGRYERWVRKLGRYDVLHAVATARLGAILVTGDWRQAKFAREVVGVSVLYIPVLDLIRVCNSG